jgi:hypothetical protein
MRTGQRPIAAFIGGAGSDAVVQYVENEDGGIIGANVVIGGAAPVEAVIAAIGAASDVVVNALHDDVLALPSLSFSSKKVHDCLILVELRIQLCAAEQKIRKQQNRAAHIEVKSDLQK